MTDRLYPIPSPEFPIDISLEKAVANMDFNFTSGSALLKICEDASLPISQVMMEREYELKETPEIEDRMKRAYGIMKEAIATSLARSERSMGGLIGGEARKLDDLRKRGENICGSPISKAITYAMGVLECNASMGLIVAAPTAGSSGVLPGVLVALQEECGFSDEDMETVLFNAGAIGYIIARNATVSGAEGGCQAEVGAASAMAASAVVELMGGSPSQCLDAAATAIANVLGLVCDPVAGLVEVPCQKRNAMGAANALVCAEIALAGIENIIPFDETVGAMYRVGKSMPCELRETALGGIATTPTAQRLSTERYGRDGVSTSI